MSVEQGLRVWGGCMSSLLDMLVCTHQSLNRSNQVRKACVLCDKLTSGDENTHRKRKWRWKAWRVEEQEEAAMEDGLNFVAFDPNWATPRDTFQKDVPSFAPLCLTQSTRTQKKNPSYLQSNPEKNLAPSALQSKLANVELSDLSAETIHTVYAVCSTTPTSLLLRLHGCISQAQMGFSATRSRAWHALNNGRQMTSQLHLMMASADVAAFHFFFFFLDVVEYKGSVIH